MINKIMKRDIEENQTIKMEENKPPLATMLRDSLRSYKNEVLVKKVNDVYNDMLQGLPSDKINLIESTTKKIVNKENIANCLDLILNYLGLERLIKRFVDLQNYINYSLRKEGVSEQMLIDILYFLTGEDIYMSLAMKNELTNAFYKMRLLTNADMQTIASEQFINNLCRINPN